MALTSIGTPSSSQSAILDLLELSGDISDHASSSLTKAHAINVFANNYYDSGGNLYGAYVLRLVVGGAVVYVPAQVPNPDPGPGNPQANLPNLNSLEQTIVGSPAPATLISPVSSTYASEVTGLIADLIQHARLNHDLAHNGMTLITGDPTLNNLGNVVARNKISISINGQTYFLLCDPNSSGPIGPLGLLGPAYWNTANGQWFGSVGYGPVWANPTIFNINSEGGFDCGAALYQKLNGSTDSALSISWTLEVSANGTAWTSMQGDSAGNTYPGANYASFSPEVKTNETPWGVLSGPVAAGTTVGVGLAFKNATTNVTTPNFYFRFAFSTPPSYSPPITIYSSVLGAMIQADV